MTRLVLFDDRLARDWQPFALTRPVGELLFGAHRLVERVEAAFGIACAGYLTSDHLADFVESGAAAPLQKPAADAPTIYWCARAVPRAGVRLEPGAASRVYLMDGAAVGCLLPAGEEPNPEFVEALEHRGKAERVEVGGVLLQHPWDLVADFSSWLDADLAHLAAARTPELPVGIHTLGEGSLSLGTNVEIEPGTVFDLRGGPIRIEDDAIVRAGTRLAGPALVGRSSKLLGGSFDTIATGPHSYLRGEVSHSVVLGYTNKAHDGYLGHSYVGRWVNLGAFTTNSDLKNNYHSVRVWTPSGTLDTEIVKVGCFLGDHVKTGIGTLLGTGTVIGAGANVFGDEMPPRHVPPFSWGGGGGGGGAGEPGEYRLEAFVDTAAQAMSRRGVELDERGRRYLESCWRKGRGG